jgi:hypothetical protein
MFASGTSTTKPFMFMATDGPVRNEEKWKPVFRRNPL